MTKLNVCTISMMMVVAAILIQLALGQNSGQNSGQSQQQQPNNLSNCPSSRIMNALRSSLNSNNRQPVRVQAPQRPVASTEDTPLVRRRRQLSQPPAQEAAGPIASGDEAQGLGVDLTINKKQQDDLKKETSYLQKIIQSIQLNVTQEQLQQIMMTLAQILFTLFIGTSLPLPVVAVLRQVLNYALPVIVKALLDIAPQINASASLSVQ